MIGITPRMRRCEVARHGVLHLEFADGLCGEVEVLSRMWGRSS